MKQVIGISVHFGQHPPETATLDVIEKGEGGSTHVERLALIELRALRAKTEAGQIITGVDVIDAIERMARVVDPALPRFNRGKGRAASPD